MNGQNEGAVVLGGVKPRMPEITVYPFAQVDIHEGGLSAGDATHHMRITLPANGKEIAIPYNLRSLRALVHEVTQALRGDQTNTPLQEGS